MAGVFKIKNVEDAEFTLTHPDGVGAVSIASNNIAKIDAVNAALALKANTVDLKELGVGQTWQNVTASRSSGVTYTNSTGKPIMVYVHTNNGSAISITINSISFALIDCQVGYNNAISFIVPNNGTYIMTGALITVRELR